MSRLVGVGAAVVVASLGALGGPATAIVFDRPLRVTLAPKSTNRYTIPLDAGEFLDVDLWQKTDVVLHLLDRDGKELRTSDVFQEPDARERIFWIVGKAGGHQLVIEGDRFGGDYILTVRKRQPDDRDHSLLAAQELFSRAERILQKGPIGADEAADLLRQMESAASKAGDAHLQMTAMLWRCHALRLRGRYPEERSTAQQALLLAEREKDDVMAAFAHYHIGIALYESGRFSQGLESLRRCADLSQRGGRELASAMPNSLIASMLEQIGVLDEAEERAQKALAVFRKFENQRGEAAAHLTIGSTNTDRKNFDKAAQEYGAALAIYRELKDSVNEAVCLRNLGNVEIRKGNLNEAEQLLRKAETLMRQSAPKGAIALVLRVLAGVYLRQQRINDAKQALAEALELSRQAGIPAGEAGSLMGMARVAGAEGDLDNAKFYAEQSLSIVEDLRQTLTEEGLRADHLSAQRAYFTYYVEILDQLRQARPGGGYVELAFEASERSRARGLVEFLQRNKIRLDETIDPSLLQRRADAQRQLQKLVAEQTKLLTAPETASKAAELQERIQEARRELDRVKGLVRSASPVYASVAEFRPVTVAELQAKHLDADTVLVEYLCSPERTYIWVISRDSVRLVTTTGLNELESLIRGGYSAITARNTFAPNEAASARLTRLRDAGTQWETAARRLSAALLDPIRQELEGKERVLIVPDLPLSYIPFAALPDPALPEKPWITRQQLSILPSASVLNAIRDSTSGRPSPEKLLAVLADPVFDPHDPRLTRRQSRGDGKSSLRGGGMMRASFALDRLPYTRREANAIASMADASERLIALDLDANRDLAISGRLSGYRIVHFATHSVLDGQFPDASGIVLSLVNEKGEYVDGVVRLEDVYRMKLGADIVVLSACQTGLGTKLNAEGFIGLARGMLYAGASRVVASLWKVDDAAAAEWMRLFYTALLREKKSPGEAARYAQAEMAASKRWRSPYYWSGFVVIGEP